MLYKSRWPLTPPPVSLPTFIFGSPSNETRSDTADKKIFIDTKDAKDRYLTLLSYRTWAQRFAAGLVEAGFSPGDRIMLFSGNSFFTPVVVMGTIMAQGIFNSANPGYKDREVLYQVRDCEPKFILAAPNCMKKAEEAAKSAGMDASSVFLFEDLESAESYGDLDRPHQGRHWSALLASANDGVKFEWQESDSIGASSKTAVLVYSSGTTGLPKGVEISQSQLVSNILQLQRTSFSNSSITERRTISVLPMYHGLGLVYYCLIAPKLGMQVYIMERYDTTALLQSIDAFAITELLLVPAMVVAMAKHAGAQEGHFNLSTITKVIAGAAPLGKEVTEIFEQLWKGKVRLRQAFGMSEAPALSLAWDEQDISNFSSTSVGELLPGLEARIMREDGKEEENFGRAGELWLRGPNIMKAYWRQPKATADTVTNDGWLKTGDVAYNDGKGKFYIVDRKKEMIKVRGAQVAPAELEALLLEHPQIVDAAVVGVKAAAGDGEEPRAYLVPRSRVMVSEQELMDYVQRRVSKHKRLCGGVAFVDSLPRTAAGKILRRELRIQANKEQRPRANI